MPEPHPSESRSGRIIRPSSLKQKVTAQRELRGDGGLTQDELAATSMPDHS